MSTYWNRRIDDANRIVYRIEGETINLRPSFQIFIHPYGDDFAFDASGRFSEGISWVEKDGEHYYINKKGEQLEGASTEVYYAYYVNT